jgi:hypothetical protein
MSESESSEGSREKCPCSSASWRLSSTEAGSEGEVVDTEDSTSSSRAAVCGFRDRRVGRLGVDFDWKPVGTVFPRLWGGMSLYEGLTTKEPHVTMAMACFLRSNAWLRLDHVERVNRVQSNPRHNNVPLTTYRYKIAPLY